ncbi:hypothetical protein GCM10008090_17470 [Arenicella chitinivorans]|uniref:Uncharacterized protein n=1 Tax=Arenicella chitinivorans TaxID=1329800 RepID=A0A918RRF3_9GAMM|nr:hypothetical protein GCM10008090_17470 [Arenicella chitinivorans]
MTGRRKTAQGIAITRDVVVFNTTPEASAWTESTTSMHDSVQLLDRITSTLHQLNEPVITGHMQHADQHEFDFG